MEIKKIKELCEEHENLVDTNKLLKNAISNRNWIKIKTPDGESELSDDAVILIVNSNCERLEIIEELLKCDKDEI